jgi:hypothetical protein
VAIAGDVTLVVEGDEVVIEDGPEGNGNEDRQDQGDGRPDPCRAG